MSKQPELESIVVLVDKSRKEEFLAMLKSLNFARMQTKSEIISRYIETAPDINVVSEDEIMYEVKAVRNKKK